MKLSVYCLPIAFLLASCSSNMKRVMVFAKGSASINTDTKTIVVKDGGGSEEKTADFNQSGILNLKLMKEDGENSLVMSDNGLYVVNAKNDTIIGSYQKYGEVPKEMRKFTQDELKKGIDSLIGLTQNKNISAANRNFFILPYQSVKISNNIDAFVVAPYHRMTSLEKEAGKEPEVYRFWSIKEIRETIDKLQKMTVAPPVSSTK
jgi:hypothetical protein